MSTQELTQDWDKVFPLSEKVNHQKVTFKTQYGLTLAADLYTPKDAKGKLPAIAVSGPFGASKEQSSGLYVMRMADSKAMAGGVIDPLPDDAPQFVKDYHGSAVMIMHGEKAHSRYFGEAAYHYMVDGKAEGYKFAGEPNPVPGNKELLIIPNNHSDT